MVDYEAEAERGMMWYKFSMIERVIKQNQHDWVWWVDFDTLFTNMTKNVEDVIDGALATLQEKERNEVDLILTPDW